MEQCHEVYQHQLRLNKADKRRPVLSQWSLLLSGEEVDPALKLQVLGSGSCLT